MSCIRMPYPGYHQFRRYNLLEGNLGQPTLGSTTLHDVWSSAHTRAPFVPQVRCVIRGRQASRLHEFASPHGDIKIYLCMPLHGGGGQANALRNELRHFVQSCGAVAASANQWAQQIIDKVGGPRTEKALKTGDVDARLKAILSLNAATGSKLPAGLSIATETRKRPRAVIAAQLRLDLSVFKASSPNQLSLLEEVNARSGPGVVLVDPIAAKPFLASHPWFHTSWAW